MVEQSFVSFPSVVEKELIKSDDDGDDELNL